MRSSGTESSSSMLENLRNQEILFLNTSMVNLKLVDAETARLAKLRLSYFNIEHVIEIQDMTDSIEVVSTSSKSNQIVPSASKLLTLSEVIFLTV
jgi:hypothetical protein